MKTRVPLSTSAPTCVPNSIETKTCMLTKSAVQTRKYATCTQISILTNITGYQVAKVMVAIASFATEHRSLVVFVRWHQYVPRSNIYGSLGLNESISQTESRLFQLFLQDSTVITDTKTPRKTMLCAYCIGLYTPPQKNS